MSCKYSTILVHFYFIFLTVNAQGQSSFLNSFYGVPGENEVVLKIELSQGNTCNGIKVFRGASQNNFYQIGFIPGICGSPSSAVSYEFTDSNPFPNQHNYYYVELGNSGISETILVEFLKIPKEKYLLRGQPVFGDTELIFINKSAGIHQLVFYDLSGKIVHERNISDDRTAITRDLLHPGLYVFRMYQNSVPVFSGKIIF